MIVRLSGGLGNQFFQYAFGRAYSEKTGERMDLDTWSFYRDKLRNYELDNYNIKKGKKRFWRRVFCNIVWELKTHIGHTAWLEKLAKMECEKENFLLQDIKLKDAYVVGYWHNVKFFDEYSHILRNELKYTGEISEVQRNLIETMKQEQSVAMHVRRTDHLVGQCKKIYADIEKEYYLSAMEYLKEQVGDVQIYVFSDDIQWCKKEYADIENLIFIDSSISVSPHTDMELMRNCKHFIITNSTFSWWSSYLAKYEEKIIVAPKRWLVDDDKDRKMIDALARDYILI